MGCAGSKLDDLQAVALCRDRAHLLDEAIRYRYALADAHVAYIQALRSVGFSLQRFLDGPQQPPTSSPLLPLPTQRKGDPDPLPNPITNPDLISAQVAASDHSSHSNSGSHLHFHSDHDSDSGSESLLSDSEIPHAHDGDLHVQYSYNNNYMRSQPPPPATVTLEHQPESRRVQVGESLFENAPFSYPNMNPTPYSYPFPQPSYAGYGGLFGSPLVYQGFQPSSPPPAKAKPGFSAGDSLPSPPSPPRASTWEFLNPFESYEKFYPAPNTPSQDSREVREEEGIPDLEEEYQREVVKEIHGEQKFVAESASPEDRGEIGGGEEQPGGLEFEVHLLEKVEEERVADRGNSLGFKSRGVPEVLREIKVQFDKAAESGNGVSKMLEAGRIPYHRKNGVHKASSRMLNVITPSLSVVNSYPSTSKSGESLSADKGGSLFLDFDGDKGMKAGNLSSTLEKLYIWEKKLYDEVKAEEKMRVDLERKCRRLKHLDERGAEAHKVDATHAVIRKLSTKIRIAIQVVNSISSKIDKLRDEELWPQISELIQGLLIMWKIMHECHQNQCRVISEAKNLDSTASDGKLSESYREATFQLVLDLLDWILQFYTWVVAQKGYVRALNGWLLKCLLYEPEETPDGIAPFSPGRIGAPPVFVICNQWAQAMDRISENEVMEAVQDFATSVHQLWERDLERQQRIMGNRDMERRVKALEGEEQRMQRALDLVNKKLLIVSEQNGTPLPGLIALRSHAASNGSLQGGLKHIFEAMERFSADSIKAYEELRTRSDEDRPARENVKVP